MGIKEVLGIKDYSNRHGLNNESLTWDLAYRYVGDELVVFLVLTDGHIILHDIPLGGRYNPKEFTEAVRLVQRYVKDTAQFVFIVQRLLQYMFPSLTDNENEI